MGLGVGVLVAQLLLLPCSDYELYRKYDVEHLERVDMSRKHLTLNLIIEDHPDTMPFRQHQESIMNSVDEFCSCSASARCRKREGCSASGVYESLTLHWRE